MQIVEKYYEWSQAYQEDQITVVYDTMWDGTKKLAHKIADEIAKQSPDTRVKIFNISKTNKKRHHDRSIQIKSDCRLVLQQ